jgi:NAD(P)-dependent dehydrogenase (short-subunit alcohol dehydrogenase family)
VSTELNFDGRVAIVTGAGRGLGRAYALALAARGARVVVNDLGGALAGGGNDHAPAQTVVDEIAAAGGQAVANFASVATTEGAESIAATALEHFGGIDIVINNAGNLDPGGMPELTVEALARHIDVHALGAFNVTRAAWPTMVQAGYGRVVLTTSIGMYGGGFLISYSTAKGAALSLARALADGGEPHGIKVNAVAPAAETRMVHDPEFRAKCHLPPVDPDATPDPNRDSERVVPMVLVLAHQDCPVSGETMWAGLGRFARIFVGETRGVVDPTMGPEDVLARWDEIVDEDGYATPKTTAEAVSLRESLIAAALTNS